MKNDYFTLTTLTEYLNKTFKEKVSGQPFNTTDVEFYIKRKKIPKYLGGDRIEKIEGIKGVKLYILIKN
jgi:ABC-type transport system substrate-binding protein